MTGSKTKTICDIIFLLATLQLLRFIIKQGVFLFVERTNFSDRMASLLAMAILLGLLVLFARIRREPLSVFPVKFSGLYIVATIVFALVLISSLTLFSNEKHSIYLLIYSCLVIPAFEELIFRGYVWNKLDNLFPRPWITYSVTTLLFAIWHLGYIDALAFRTETNLAHVMMWKVITGFIFGIVLGAIRLKAKNCYSTILLHGMMNMLGR